MKSYVPVHRHLDLCNLRFDDKVYLSDDQANDLCKIGEAGKFPIDELHSRNYPAYNF
jgi:hypothetical protein